MTAPALSELPGLQNQSHCIFFFAIISADFLMQNFGTFRIFWSMPLFDAHIFITINYSVGSKRTFSYVSTLNFFRFFCPFCCSSYFQFIFLL